MKEGPSESDRTEKPGEPVSLLRIEGLWKTYHDHAVLRGIDLEVAPHEVVCLIGASGSGKSTLLRCVNLLETVDDGTIHLDGVEITDVRADPDDVRRRMGIVFQAFNLFPHMTVLDNITLAPRKVHGVGRAEAEERARELLGRFGLADKAGAYPDRLSGGQQQRVAIIRAMATRPRLMLLDEVTSALDPELVAEVLGVIRELKESGMTMILTTHEMGFCREIADTVCFLDEGVLLERGTPGQIFTDPRESRTREFLKSVLDARRA
ncbi:peptide ABC transporter ATP-binding protein [Planobispora siamensis]|uniref:Peptide ABC transporter ATP-binding protein n=1 Tax=Planobispora siamensis TaxID=936338 RepID=A0A8J3SHN0_9ACTN|nr:peptide ABC transporter ATP-binding protein [Planobispora siamensis]